jgi:hypothetical protein
MKLKICFFSLFDFAARLIAGCHYQGVHYQSGSQWNDPDDPCQVISLIFPFLLL